LTHGSCRQHRAHVLKRPAVERVVIPGGEADPPVGRWRKALHDAVLASAVNGMKIVHMLSKSLHPFRARAEGGSKKEGAPGRPLALLCSCSAQRFRLLQILSYMRATFSGHGGTDSR